MTPVRVKVMGMVKLAVQFPSQKVVREGCIAWSSLIRRCVHACVCASTCVCMCVCTLICVCVRACVYGCVCVCTLICLCASIPVCVTVCSVHLECLGPMLSQVIVTLSPLLDKCPQQVADIFHFLMVENRYVAIHPDTRCAHNSPWHTLCSQFTLTHTVLTIHPDTHCAHYSP